MPHSRLRITMHIQHSCVQGLSARGAPPPLTVRTGAETAVRAYGFRLSSCAVMGMICAASLSSLSCCR